MGGEGIEHQLELEDEIAISSNGCLNVKLEDITEDLVAFLLC